MKSIMVKILPLAFSILLFSGCGEVCPPPVVVVPSPKLVYPEYNTSKPFKIHGRKQNGKIILNPSEFKKITEKIIEQKYEIKTLQDIIDTANKWKPMIKKVKKK